MRQGSKVAKAEGKGVVGDHRSEVSRRRLSVLMNKYYGDGIFRKAYTEARDELQIRCHISLKSELLTELASRYDSDRQKDDNLPGEVSECTSYIIQRSQPKP